MPTKVEVSHRTIIFIVVLSIALWFLFQVREIIFWIFVAFILMSAMKPSAEYLERYKIPRVVAILLHFIVIIVFIGFTGSSIIPPLITESIKLSENLPAYLHAAFPFLTIDAQVLTQHITPVGENIVKVTIGVFSNVITLFTIFVISFYLLIERKYLEPQLAAFMGEKGAEQLVAIVGKIEEQLGSWVRGQLTLALIIGFSTFIGLSLIQLPYVLPLSILAGLLEIVPIIGPIISAIPAILVALIHSPVLALTTVAMYFLIQQAEAHLVVPMVMRRAVGLPPLVTIIALMVGGKLAGITGALLAVPVVVTVVTAVTEYLKLQTNKKTL